MGKTKLSEAERQERITELCREIGNFFGEYAEDKYYILIDTGDTVHKYLTHAGMLIEWLDTLIESQEQGGGTWENEIIFIYENVLHKHPVGIRKFINKKNIVWKSAVDIRCPGHLHGKNFHLGTYNSIVDAISARKHFLSDDLTNININTEDGINQAIQKAAKRRIAAKEKQEDLRKIENT